MPSLPIQLTTLDKGGTKGGTGASELLHAARLPRCGFANLRMRAAA